MRLILLRNCWTNCIKIHWWFIYLFEVSQTTYMQKLCTNSNMYIIWKFCQATTGILSLFGLGCHYMVIMSVVRIPGISDTKRNFCKYGHTIFKSDWINKMDHARFGYWAVIIDPNPSKRLKCDACIMPKQVEAQMGSCNKTWDER